MKTADTDILVLGSGIAGLFYAIKCSAFAKVTVVTKGHIGESNTMYAQGGIAAVFDATDTVAEHFNDTLTAGDGLCDRPAVQLLRQNNVCLNLKSCMLILIKPKPANLICTAKADTRITALFTTRMLPGARWRMRW